MIERIKIKSLADSHFCVINETEWISKAEVRTLCRLSAYRKKTINVVQCKTYSALNRLHFKYADECRGTALSLLDYVLSNLYFGLGDIRPQARHLVFYTEGYDAFNVFLSHPTFSGTPLASADNVVSTDMKTVPQIIGWVRKNCRGSVVALEGSKAVRISFDDENDFLLARLKFS